MTLAKKIPWSIILLCLFLLVIFIVSVLPLRDFDIWFHVKSGEIIARYGIIHHDVFSWSAHGREWFPYEWLYQWSMYWITHWFGMASMSYVTAAAVTIQIGLVYALVRRMFRVGQIAGMVVSFFFFASVFEFYSARPHVIAYTLLIATLYLILDYVIYDRNRLWLSLPFVLIWANLHGSMFLAPFFFGAYALLAYGTYRATHTPRAHRHAVTLGIYAVVTAGITLLPPVGITQYRLLWYFFQNETFLSHFIDEWTPLTANGFAFFYYTAETILIAGTYLALTIKKKAWMDMQHVAPLSIFLVLSYTASRNVFLGYIALVCLLAWIIRALTPASRTVKRTVLISLLVIPFIIFHVWLVGQKHMGQQTYFPAGAVTFLKDHQLYGHMFNEYSYGGYLLYSLYPRYQVFFDGRTDVYLCCEMRDTLDMAVKKYLPDNEYKQFLDSFWNKYDISYVILRTQKHSVIRKITNILTDDPQWSLVYWDDVSQIFVRHDRKNAAIVEKFGAIAATPYSRDPYKTGQESQAMTDYQDMVAIADSARSRNAIGYLLLKKQKVEDARVQFERAIALDPTFESPYMNLAEIAASQGNISIAIELYQTAKKYAPDRGLIYQRLGELMLASSRDPAASRAIWQEGIQNTVDEDAKKQLQKLLQTN